MIAPAATIVDVHALVEVIWVSLLAGIGLTVVFSLTILGTTRAGAARRAGRMGSAGGYAVLAALSGAAVAAMLVAGVVIMLRK